jgi:hypothetical protein
MVATTDTNQAWGSELASWGPLTYLLIGYAVIVAGLLVFGRGKPLARIPDAIERLTGLPGWAVASAGTAVYGLLVAGQGFYSDVWWHIALGRDKDLFTAPHTSIVIGLGMIFVAAALGVTAATVTGVDTRLRVGALRVPWSMVPLAVLGGSALVGFPLDELWHEQYGIDVTMWSPTHMLMILGASFTGVAAWLVLADAGISPRDSHWARGAHVVAALLTVLGLSASQGEFEFGVPQFQQMFLPLLLTIAAAFTFVAIRLVHGRGWALGLGVVIALARAGMFGGDGFGGGGGVQMVTRAGGLYLVSALVVELVGLVAGTEKRLRFAVLSGVGVATLGLAGEWAWNQHARQPWNANLLPDVVPLCLVVGVGTAIVAAAFGTAVARERARLPRAVVAGAGLAVVVALALPMPRHVGDVTAEVTLEREPRDDAASRVWVQVTLDPADAAGDARWFQAMSWQGGGLVIAEMERVGPGEYRSDRPVPVDGRWKAMLRLHRGGELMAVPLYLPADEEIGEPEVAAADRTVAFAPEGDFLLRETVDGDEWFAYVVYGLLAGVGVLWAVAFALAAGRLGPRAAGPRQVAAGVGPPSTGGARAALPSAVPE